MRRILNSVIVALAVAACNEGPTSPSVPQPGSKQIPQIFVLSDATRPLTDYWGFPSREALVAGLSARVEWETVKNKDEAVERLRIWNARPVDVLVLGPGLPAEVWKSISLPKVQGRKALVVGEAAAAGGETTAVTVAAEDAQRFEKAICASVKKCQVINGSERDTLPDGTPLHLNVVVHWREFLKDLLAGKSGLGAKPVKLDFFSGYLEARKGPALASPQETQAFEKTKREFMLNALSQGGSL